MFVLGSVLHKRESLSSTKTNLSLFLKMNDPWMIIVTLFFLSTVACQSCRYEKFTPDHSACKPRNATCKFVNNYVNMEEQHLIVKLHNQYREKIAEGRKAEGSKTFIRPPSANMREMEWDDELAYVAQKHAETCSLDYDCDECRKVDRFDVVGQNIYEAPSDNFPKVWNEMLEAFLQISISQHTQLVWAETWKMGCGKVHIGVRGKRKVFIVCNYAQGANSEGQPFEFGDPCSKCPSGTCCGNYCGVSALTSSRYQKLCSLEYKCNYEKFSLEHIGCKPRNRNCTIEEEGVRTDEKHLIVKLHNDYRENIALGNVGDQPSAANMRQMVWDDELAYLAQRQAETCDPKEDLDCIDCTKTDRFDFVGQRIYESSSSDDESTSLNFISELEKMLNPDYLDDPQAAQLRFADTWRLGCGKVVKEEQGKSKMIIVCNYGPSLHPRVKLEGNIYTLGMPCTDCPEGTCCGKKCKKIGVNPNYKALCKSSLVDTPGFDQEFQRCKYRKFSLDHAACKPRNFTCKIINNHVSYGDKEAILMWINDARAFPNDLYNLSKPANMMHMEWDDELAMLGQRHAETCNRDYDCHECRRVDRFAVNQFVYNYGFQKPPMLWNEMAESYFIKKGHLSEILWAEIWRIGCGKVEFLEGRTFRALIVCNFAPEVTRDGPHYIAGDVCTECPMGTCCAIECSDYGLDVEPRGLCRSLHSVLWEPNEDFEILCRFSLPADLSSESVTDHVDDLECRLSIIGESSTDLMTTEDFEFVKCGFSSSEDSNTADSLTCRLPSAGDLLSSELGANATINDFEFIKCALFPIAGSPDDSVECGLSRAAKLPAVPDSLRSRYFTCELSGEPSTSDAEDFHPVNCFPGVPVDPDSL